MNPGLKSVKYKLTQKPNPELTFLASPYRPTACFRLCSWRHHDVTQILELWYAGASSCGREALMDVQRFPVLCSVDSLNLAHCENLYHRKKKAHCKSALSSQELAVQNVLGFCYLGVLCVRKNYDDCHLVATRGHLRCAIQVYIPIKSKYVNMVFLGAWWFCQLL